MRTHYHSDDGAPCWKCSGTIFTYTVDDTVSYVAAYCIGCGADNMFQPKTAMTDAMVKAAFVSEAHRQSAGWPKSTLNEQRMIASHQLGMRDHNEGRPMTVPIYLRSKDERDAYVAGYRGAAKRVLKPMEVTSEAIDRTKAYAPFYGDDDHEH